MSERLANWVFYNASLLAVIFGPHNVVVDDTEWTNILILNFRLPPNWAQPYSRLLIVLPSGDGVFHMPPEHFYLDLGLTTVDGLTPPHYYEGHGFNDRGSEGWARYSYHIRGGWNPRLDTKGTTLVNLLDGLYVAMQEAAEEA